MNPYMYVGLPEIEQLCHRFGVSKADPNYIIAKTCEVLDLSIDILKSSCRKREYSEARFIICGLAFKVNPTLTLVRMGHLLGGRDHSTIIYALRTYDQLEFTDRSFSEKVLKVKSEV